jgi:signal transduction histidine kinase
VTNQVARTRHLIFLAHIWVCAPFFYYWLVTPYVRVNFQASQFKALTFFAYLIVAYFAVRTVLAFKSIGTTTWHYIYPPIDVAVVSMLIYLGDRDPLNHASLLYFFPVAEAAGSLSIAWSAAVGLMVLAGAGIATNGFVNTDGFATFFRYFFIILMASLLAALARISAALREQVGVARDRARIAMEMHDGVQGHLITVASQMELAQHLAERDPQRTAQLARESKDTARLAADELRFLVQRLRAPSMAGGFLAALKQFAHNQAERNGLALEFESRGEAVDLDPETENALFRIAQETITNVLRHAEAKNLKVEVTFTERDVSLAIRDDGKGFDPGEEQDGMHAGLQSIKQRASALSGSLAIASTIGQGCSVQITLPRKSEAAHA